MRKTLIENCQSININTIVKSAKQKLFEEIIKSEIQIQSDNIWTNELIKFTRLNVWNWWYKTYFICPYCNKSIWKLYKHESTWKTACRSCNGLEYKQRQFNKMSENINKTYD